MRKWRRAGISMNRFSIGISSLLIWAVLWSFFSAQPCSAQEDEEIIATVRRIYIEGFKFFQKHRYEEAAVQFQLAYKLLKESIEKGKKTKKIYRAIQKLRYFLGVSYYRAKKYRRAEKYLRELLTNEPKPKNNRKKKAEEIYKKVKAIVAELERKEKLKKPKPPPPPPPKKPRYRWNVWPFAVLGLGLGTLAAAGITGFLTSSKQRELKDNYQKLKSSADPKARVITEQYLGVHDFALTTNILLISGGTITAGGLLFTILFAREKISPTNSPRKGNQKRKGITLTQRKPH